LSAGLSLNPADKICEKGAYEKRMQDV